MLQAELAATTHQQLGQLTCLQQAAAVWSAMPSPMSGRGKEFMGYRISDTALLVGALAIFVAVRFHLPSPDLVG